MTDERIASFSTILHLIDAHIQTRKDILLRSTMPTKRHENDLDTIAKHLTEKPDTRRNGEVGRSEPPSLETMVFCANEADVQKTRNLSRSRLEELGFSWEADVEEVSPVIGTSSFRWLKEAPNPHLYSFTTSLRSVYELRRALELALEAWPIFRSLAVEFNDTTRLLISLRANESFFDRAISVHEDVQDEEALTRIESEDNHLDSELPHGLLLRAKVARIMATGTTGCVLVINHAVWDAVTLNSFSEDLESALAGLSRPPRTPYKVFADTYFLHRSSLTAKRAIDFHLHRLQNLGSMSEALWPSTIKILSRRQDKNANSSINGISREFRNIPIFNRSQSYLSIPPSIIVKAAIAIFNTRKTGSNFAILSILLAARRWPFLEKGLADLLPSPLNIAGPTMTHAVDVIKIDPQETLGQLLSKMHQEQRLLSEFAHVPPDFITSLSDESRAVYADALRQFYNWLPAPRVHDQRLLQLVQQRGLRRPSRSFVWELSRALEDGEVKMRILYDAGLFEPSDVEFFGNELVNIIAWLGDQDNWVTKILHMPSFIKTSHNQQQRSSRL